MTQLALTALPYRPSSPLTGSERVIYRAANLMLRGLGDYTYLEAYAGSENLGETFVPVIITGDVDFDTASQIVTGSGTSFLDELHLGQMCITDGGTVLVVAELLTQTTFRNARPFTSGESGASVSRLPVIFPLDINRGVQLRGNALHFDKGTILSVGDGVLYVNGQPLQGESLTASRQVQVALYDSTTGNYDVQDLGFPNIPGVVNTDITVVASGGTKNMSLGFYSFEIAYYSDITGGFSNPTATLLDGGTDGYEIDTANSTINFNFTSDIPNRPAKATGYIIYASAYGGSSAISKVNAIQGAWFELRRINFNDLVGNQIAFDYVDNDLSATIASFDNDDPPDAEFLATLDRFPCLVSTNGQGVNSPERITTTSPGAYTSPSKPANLDAFPSTYKSPTEKGETIIGVVSAAGRFFVMTPNTLQAVTLTGLDAQPITTRPFWKRGFTNPYNLIFVNDTLYGFSGNKMFRSIATGDEGNESYDFASDVESQLLEVNAGYMLLGHDPKNEIIASFSSAIRQNNAGYWETDVWIYSLTKFQWMPKIVLSDDTRDLIVSGVATVGNNLTFLAGGRRNGTTDRVDTFIFSSPSGEPVPWYCSWSFSDMTVEMVAKILRKIRPKGKFTDTSIQVYAVESNTDIDITDLETGANPVFTYNLTDSTVVKQYDIKKVRCKNMLMWTLRIAGTSTVSDATDLLDQIHEIAVEMDISGQLR